MYTQKDFNFSQRRVLELLKNYNMSIHHHLGKDNFVVDALSRVSMRSAAHLDKDNK